MKLFNLLRQYTTLEDVPRLANKQGVAGLLYHDVIESEENPSDSRWLMRLSGYVQNRQKRYHLHKEEMEKLARFYDRYGIGMVVLKGYGLSLNWPTSDFRQPGDLDIFLFDKRQRTEDSRNHIWQYADRLVEEKLGIQVDDSHEHHTCFSLGDLGVENHYDIIDTKTHKDGKLVDCKLKDLVLEHVKTAIPVLDNVYLPSADFNAIFLMRHMGQDFGSTHTSLRQICDWGFFIEKHSAEVDWEMVIPFLKEMGIIKFFHIINAICVDYLGFDEKAFPEIVHNTTLEKRILDDLFNPEFSEVQPKGKVIQNIIFKTRRYWKNSWKKEFIFKYSPFVDFFYGVRMHLGRWKTLGECVLFSLGGMLAIE